MWKQGKQAYTFFYLVSIQYIHNSNLHFGVEGVYNITDIIIIMI